MKDAPGINVKNVLKIGIREDGQVALHGPLHDKKFCFSVLAAAINLVAGYEPPTEKIARVEPRLIIPGNGGRLK